MSNGGTDVQAMLKTGLLPFLLQKAGIPTGDSGGGGGPSLQPPMAPQGPNPNPQLTQAQRPGLPQQASPGPQIRPSPGAGVSNFAPPVAQPIADVRGLQSLLMGWSSRKEQKKHAEAANAAQALMQAIEGGKRTGDWSQATDILHQNESLFNKVYKGWLQKEQDQQKAAGQKPDPETSGVEAGIGQYMKSKQAQTQAPQGGAQGGAPRSLGGYYLPQAGPSEFAQNVGASAAAQAAQADPARTLASQLKSDEMREAELAKYGLVSTPRTEAEMKKYEAEVEKSRTGWLTAQTNLQKTQAELKTQQARAEEARVKGEADVKINDSRYQKSLVDLDIAKAKLASIQAHPPGSLRSKQPPASSVQHLNMADQALTYVESVLNSKRADSGFTKEDVQMLTQLLGAAGATSLAKDLPNAMMRYLPSWLGGKGGKDYVQSTYDAVQSYYDQLNQGMQDRYPDYKGHGVREAAPADEGAAASDEEPDDTTDEGDATLPPGWTEAPKE